MLHIIIICFYFLLLLFVFSLHIVIYETFLTGHCFSGTQEHSLSHARHFLWETVRQAFALRHAQMHQDLPQGIEALQNYVHLRKIFFNAT
jgi:hypothetical protein